MSTTTWKLREGMTWTTKLLTVHPNHGKLVDIPAKMQKQHGKGSMLIPDPREMDAIIRAVSKRKLLTQGQLCLQLQRQAGADATCPLTAGIFLRIVAEAANEQLQAGRKRVTPYWRIIKKDGSMNPKFPGGWEQQATQLEEEGHTIKENRNGTNAKVVDFESSLVTF